MPATTRCRRHALSVAACVLALACGIGPARAQVGCNQALSEIVAAQVAAAPLADQSRGNYQLPTQAELDGVAEAVGFLFDANFISAAETLADIGLSTCLVRTFPGAEDWVRVVFSEEGLAPETSRGVAVFAWRDVGATMAAVISVPHAVTETNVALQAVEAMAADARVRAIVVGPVHRCHRPEPAPEEFQGTTSECGGTYRQSDMAHTQASLFHAVHAALWSHAPRDVLLQIHGMSADGISVSAGLTSALMEYPNRPALLVHDELSAQLEALGESAASLTTCSLYDGPRGQRVREHLCGTRNAQRGGLLAAGLLPRFVHLEQNLGVRTDPAKRATLGAAITRVLDHVFADQFER